MILMTPRLELGIYKTYEAGLFAGWLNDPEVVKYSEQRHKKHTDETQLDYWYSPATLAPSILRTIRIQDSATPIGSIAASVDQNNNVANVGVLVGDRTQWGKGYGFEAWECFCNYLIIEQRIRKIEAGCMSLNLPMIRICIKYGMRQEAIIPGHFLIAQGVSAGMHLFGKIAR